MRVTGVWTGGFAAGLAAARAGAFARAAVLSFAVLSGSALPVVLAPPAAHAQTAQTAQAASLQALRDELDKIYDRLLNDPTDPVLNRRMVDIALKLGDYDAAIGAVERLIFFAPNDPALQIEVARLYIAIESYAAARGYLTDALALPGVEGTVKNEIETLIAEIDEATRPPVWSGIVQAGLRYQSNANIGPERQGPTQPFAVEKPAVDWNAFALATVLYNKQIKEKVFHEGSLSLYYADQFGQDRLDVGLVDANFGQRVAIDDRLSVKAYGLMQGIMLGGDPYLAAGGGGVEARYVISENLRIEPGAEYRYRYFMNSDDYSDAYDQTGHFASYSLKANGKVNDSVTWRGRFAFTDNHSVAAYQSYGQYAADLSLRYAFDIGDRDGYVFAPFVSLSQSDYGARAPTEVTAGYNTVRSDFQWSVGANAEVPVTDGTAIGAQVRYTRNNSNLDRFTYENVQVLLGPLGRF